jgi:hypothetical protein
MDRVVLVAHLKPGSRERAQELLVEHASREDLEAAFDRHAIFLSETEAVFFFEGPDADRSVRAILNDPSASEIGHWIPLFAGPLHRAPEAYFRERAAARAQRA